MHPYSQTSPIRTRWWPGGFFRYTDNMDRRIGDGLDIIHDTSGGRLTKAYDVTIPRYRKSQKNNSR